MRAGRRAHPDDGSGRVASDRQVVGAGLCTALFERWLCPLSHRHRGPFRMLGAGASKTSHRPRPQPRWMPLPGLLYAQVIKTMKRRRIVEVKHRVVFGTQAAVDQVLSACGWQINTSFIERLNLSLRQRVAAIRRRSAASCHSATRLTQPLILFQAYHNFVLPHASLHQPLGELIATNGAGSAKRWRARTPAMAAGLTDHVWSLREVLLFRVPPWPQPQVQ